MKARSLRQNQIYDWKPSVLLTDECLPFRIPVNAIPSGVEIVYSLADALQFRQENEEIDLFIATDQFEVISAAFDSWDFGVSDSIFLCVPFPVKTLLSFLSVFDDSFALAGLSNQSTCLLARIVRSSMDDAALSEYQMLFHLLESTHNESVNFEYQKTNRQLKKQYELLLDEFILFTEKVEGFQPTSGISQNVVRESSEPNIDDLVSRLTAIQKERDAWKAKYENLKNSKVGVAASKYWALRKKIGL